MCYCWLCHMQDVLAFINDFQSAYRWSSGHVQMWSWESLASSAFRLPSFDNHRRWTREDCLRLIPSGVWSNYFRKRLNLWEKQKDVLVRITNSRHLIVLQTQLTRWIFGIWRRLESSELRMCFSSLYRTYASHWQYLWSLPILWRKQGRKPSLPGVWCYGGKQTCFPLIRSQMWCFNSQWCLQQLW